MVRSYEYTAHLSKENTSNLWSFLVKRLELDLNDFISGEEFEAFIAFFSELIDDDETLNAFTEINADWNNGKFVSFVKYIPLNFHFIVGPWPLSTLQPGRYNLFSRAEFELKSRKADSNYR
jgi:hypothetical protein